MSSQTVTRTSSKRAGGPPVVAGDEPAGVVLPEGVAESILAAARERRPNRTNPTGRINGWKAILNTLAIT